MGLGLTAVEARLEAVLERASKAEPSYAEFLLEVLGTEAEARRLRARWGVGGSIPPLEAGPGFKKGRTGGSPFYGARERVQQQLLLEHFQQVVLLLDGDETGRRASQRIAAQLRPQMTLRVVEVPLGRRPDQLTPMEIRGLLESAGKCCIGPNRRRQTDVPRRVSARHARVRAPRRTLG